MNYKTNASYTTKTMTEWYFGKKFVEEATASAVQTNVKTGESSFKFWKDDTGYLTIELD